MEGFSYLFIPFWGGGNEVFWLLSLGKTSEAPMAALPCPPTTLGTLAEWATSCHCSCRGTGWEGQAPHGLAWFPPNRYLLVIWFLGLAKAKAVRAIKMCRIIRQGSFQNLIPINFHGFKIRLTFIISKIRLLIIILRGKMTSNNKKSTKNYLSFVPSILCSFLRHILGLYLFQADQVRCPALPSGSALCKMSFWHQQRCCNSP